MMHRDAASSQLTTPKKVNFARLSRVVIDLFAMILRDILLSYYPRPKDLQQKIADVQVEHKLKKDMNKILDGDGYEKCDVSLLYTILRNTCQIIPPTVTQRRRMGWGGDKIPSRDCVSLGDDMERIRIIRNRVCSHVHSTEIEDGDFEKYFYISFDICKRLNGKFGSRDYVKELETLETCRMEEGSLVDLTERVKESIESNEALRDFVRDMSRQFNRHMSRQFNRLSHEIQQLREQSIKPEDFFNRDQKGSIQSITGDALDLIGKMQRAPENADVTEKSRKIIDEVIFDTCGKGGVNLQVLETRFNDLFRSTFKKTTGMKLLEYLTRNTNKFKLYESTAYQWKVMLAENNLPAPAKKNKKGKQTSSSKRNIQVEDFDVSLFYSHEEDKMEKGKDGEPVISVGEMDPETNLDSNEMFQSTECRLNAHIAEHWDDENSDGDVKDHKNSDGDKCHEKSMGNGEKKTDENMPKGKTIEPNLWMNMNTSIMTKHTSDNTLSNKHERKSTAEPHYAYLNTKLQAGEETDDKKKLIKRDSLSQNKGKQMKIESKENLLSFSPTSQSMTQSISEFLEKVHNFQKSSESFALVVGKTDIVPNIDSLALIPWLCVFDFDMNSREDGLYSVLEGHIKTVHPCTLKDRPRFSFSYTYWCQLRGNCQVPDTCMECDAKVWMNKMKTNLEEHLETLAQYISNNTKLKVVLLWPTVKEEIKFVNRFIMLLEYTILPLPDIFVIHQEPAYLEQIEPVSKLQVPYESFYAYIKTNLQKVKQRTPSRYLLPTFDKRNIPGIDEFTASHLREDLNILYLKGFQESSFDVCDIKEEGENFLRGGTLRWFVYYECDEGGFFDVKRDLMTNILSDIRKFNIQNSKSAILEVFHTPGAGGTTFSQRILWELHEEIPCVQVKSNIQSTTSDIVQNIKLLYEKTQLPILVLLDGRDDSEVKHVYNQCGLQSISVIVLHVQRIRKEPKDAIPIKGKYWIKGQVSNREAKQFCIRYLQYCDTEEKKDNLQTITENVTKGELHQVYEFGLTTFAHEYKGVEAYVKGYLQIEPGSNLDPTQKLLGYLSLVYFYGQMSLPCQLFSKLLERPTGVTFEELPFEVRQLVVKSDNHQHRGFIRICHQIVAKEILEQILGRNVSLPLQSSSQNLSHEACRNLVDFGLDFINEMKRKFDKKIQWKKNIIVEIFTKIFLHRDTQDIDEYNLQKRRPRFSRFFTDIEKVSSKQDRIRIMENLVSCCAQNPNYHAHLGRMYTLYYPGEETAMAEKHFKKAISLCEKDHNRDNKHFTLSEDHFSNSPIYHMYGMHFYHRLCQITRDLEESIFEKDIEIVLDYARNSCSNFETARENSFPGIGQSYGLIGEIMVRTEVCNYINKKINMRLSEYIRSPMSPVVAFVRESMVQICVLITQCYSTLERDEFPPSMSKQVILYKELFTGQDLAELCSLDGPLDFTRRRNMITQIKLKYGKLNRYDIFSLDERTPSNDILEIVKHLEDNFRDLEITGYVGCSTGLIESDYRDWINAIRLNQYDRETRLDKVYGKLHQWHELVHTPISKFYVFIVRATMTILNKNKTHFIETKELLEEVKKYKNHFQRPNKPREWLGTCSGVKCLIPSFFLKLKPDSGVDEVEIEHQYKPRPKFLKGTILGNNKRPLCGIISLNVCNGSQFEVFFAPVRTKEKLVGPFYQNQRVEFILGFTVSHGFMAYNVKRLETTPCEQCSRKVEFVTDERTAECKCGNLVQKLKEEEDHFLPDFI